ncbi:MAG: hypothetical protein ABIR31_11355 [Ginsengibacter sp.]
MKNSFFYILVIIISLFSCKKSANNTAEVRYEFTSTVPDQYKLEYADNISLQSENFTGASWSKTVTITLHTDMFNVNVARLTVFPPAAWANTSKSANVGLKIFLNNTLKSNVDTTLKASSTSGVFTIITF